MRKSNPAGVAQSRNEVLHPQQTEIRSVITSAARPATAWYAMPTLLYALIVKRSTGFCECVINGCLYACISLRRRVTAGLPVTTEPGQTVSEKDAWKTLQRAIQRGQVGEVRAGVIDWAKVAYPERSIQRLDQCGDVDDELADELEYLMRLVTLRVGKVLLIWNILD